MSCWRYYNHALISNLAPHETPDTTLIEDKMVWKSVGGGTRTACSLDDRFRWSTVFELVACN